MITPLISVVIPLYNRENYIETCILSLISQKYYNWEAIIVDDGSTDNSRIIVQRFLGDDRIKLISRTRTPKGAPTCRNIGIESAKGEFIMFLDSDDYLDESCLSTRVNLFLKNLCYDFLVFNMRIYHGNEIKLWNISVTEEDDITRFLRGDGVWSITGPLFKKKVFDSHKFDESLPFWQDYIFHITLLLDNFSYLKFLNIVDSNNVVHSYESISQKGFQTTELTLKRCEILFNVFNHLSERNVNKQYYQVLLIHYIKITTEFLLDHNYKLYYTINKRLFNIKGLKNSEITKLLLFFLLMSVNNRIFYNVFVRGFRVLFINRKLNNLIWKPILMRRTLATAHVD